MELTASKKTKHTTKIQQFWTLWIIFLGFEPTFFILSKLYWLKIRKLSQGERMSCSTSYIKKAT